jgi:Cu/Zn superoxide dismutase
MRAIIFGGTVLCGFLISAAPARHPVDTQSFTARLTGSAEVPPVNTQADGKAEFTVSGDTVSYTIEVNNLKDVTGAHIHLAAKMATGPVAVSLYNGPKKTVQAGQLVQGTFTAADLHGVKWETLITDMTKGEAYVNVHTSAHPKGEIRGQITSADGMDSSSD